MNRFAAAAVLVGLAAVAVPADAHPAPFSYIDARIEPGALDVNVVAHVFDVGHDLKIDGFEQLLNPSFAEPRAAAIAGLLAPRFQVAADGRPLVCTPLAASQSSPSGSR